MSMSWRPSAARFMPHPDRQRIFQFDTILRACTQAGETALDRGLEHRATAAARRPAPRSGCNAAIRFRRLTGGFPFLGLRPCSARLFSTISSAAVHPVRESAVFCAAAGSRVGPAPGRHRDRLVLGCRPRQWKRRFSRETPDAAPIPVAWLSARYGSKPCQDKIKRKQ